MKNWKRFIAACLSVTMVASIPFTAFAESSVSVKELVQKTSNKSETQEETDLEKTLSQEKPYEYFSGLKDQEKLLDACKDEELFQLKEYMKYAYIHESDLKNRQSLDAYLLISEEWRKRNVTFDKDEQEKLLQLPEKTKVYGTKFEGKDEEGKSVERTVKDFSTYMEYLQGIKKFDVPKYMEILSAFDEVKTEEDLAKAKEAFVNFEEEIYGFDEQKEKPVKEDLDKKEESSDTKPDKKPAKEASDKEQGKVPVKEDSAASAKPESLPEKPSKEEIKNPKDENSSEEKPEKEQLDESKVEESKNPSEEESSELNQLESGDDKIDENQEHKSVMNAGTWTNKEKYSKREIAKRKGLAKKLGLTEKIDEYGFLPDDYFNGKSDADIEKMPENELMNVASEEEIEDFLNKKPNPDERAGYDILQNRVNISYSDGGGTHRTGLYTIYDRNAFCIQHSKTNPWVGNAGIHYSDPQVSTNMNLRKVLYYGYGGPADIGWPAAKTAMAASEANGYDFGGSYGDAYLAEMAAKPAPPEHFEVQVVHCQVSPPKGAVLQDLAMWRWGELKSFKLTLNPNGGVSKGNTGAFTLSPNVIIGYGNWWDIGGYTPTRTGYTFNGWYNAPSGGTKVYNADGTNVPNTAYWDGLKRWIYRGNLTVYAQWTQNTYTNGISHWASGFRHGEGTNGSKDSINLANTSFSANVGSSYVMDSSKATRIPNGYRLNTTFGTSAISGSWGSYSIGTRVTQKSYGMGYEYYYVPNTYSITYNLNGGTNNSSNPSSYNVLYGVTLKNPTKTGYTFAGWYEGNTRVYGINQGANASFSNGTDMYNKLAGRKTGNVTLTAKWTPNTYTNSISHWLYGFKNEGTNGDKHAFQIGSTSFSAINGNTFTLGANNAVTPPHGCFVENYIGTSSVTGNWTDYKFGQSFTQKPTSMGFQYNYSPYQYNINYNLDGGTNNSSNPSSYNVLYGLTLKTPTKTGYKFLGWEEDLFRVKDATIYNGASRNGETFTFTNSTSGNTFTASKVQVWTNDWSRYIAQPVSAGAGTHNNIVGTYTHTEPTGNYMINVAANGTTQDYNAPLKNVYLEKGKTYTFTMGKSTVSSNQVNIGNIKITASATGINAGANASFSSATDLYNKLAARKIGDVKLTAKWKRLYALDVNAVLNGQDVASMDGSWFTFDVYINGSLYSNDVADFCTYFDAGTRYEIKDIKPKPGKKYLGTTYNTTLSGTIGNANTSVWLNFVSTHTNEIWHRMLGVKGADGESLLLGITQFDATFGTTYVMDDGRATKIPNGYKLYPQFRYNNNGVYENHDIGKTMTQEAKNMAYVYMYQAINYSITYNLDGGTNNAANPSTYNVLNGVSLKAPTKPGYKFLGWYQGDTKITDINEGKNATFSSVDEMYKELASRQTGDISLTANWTPIKYTITYEGNGATGGSTPSSNHTYDKPQTLTPNGFHKDGYYFDSWNTKPDGTGNSYQDEEEVKNLTSKDGDTVTLHAQWKPVDYKITYKGNGSTGGAEKTHLYNQKDVETNGYVLKTNKGYTDFVRANHTLVGWYQNSVVDTKAEMEKIYKQGSKLTSSQLLAIHAEQVKKGLVKETDPKVKDILLYAVWDETPSIDTSNMKKSKFYEGVDVTRADLLNGITASDKIDGSLTSQIIITKIDYSAGKLVNGKKQAAYSQTWANGMPADAKLDTWFMQLDKNDSPVTHTVTYQVKDSAGNITTAKKTIQVVYNEFPVIKATDFQFELKDAQTGKITKDVLLAQAVTNGIISASDTEDGDIKSKIELIDYDANAFKTMKQEGFVPITYRVQDSMGPGGKGKITLKTVNVNINVLQREETVRYVRFINKKYYEKNANLDRNALDGKYDQIALLSVNGGLHPFSVWYTKTAYRELITETFEKTKGTTYVYTKEDIKKMREFVKQHGVGNAKEEDALSKFADIFMTGDYILK